VGKRGQEWLGKKGWKGKRGLGKRVMVGNRRGGLIFGNGGFGVENDCLGFGGFLVAMKPWYW